eukprot:CAMPEP_0181320462 /NCGR_PEP_ID=MMETSP1101-20121128/18137_1 /TAXON_ID=46948 /ORGANISM="Rhodomonas abbreviata, Strain Caron Lab Isolate" /LENGTH=88 /DNA_ID=CAMNT_0023428169 /DNA_START=413 /DNA_END=679 /DNA_ORIENTATION=-
MGKVRFCPSCDSRGDWVAKTCAICGESMLGGKGTGSIDVWASEIAVSTEPFDKDKMEPIVWSSRVLRIRGADGTARVVSLPVPENLGE